MNNNPDTHVGISFSRRRVAAASAAFALTVPILARGQTATNKTSRVQIGAAIIQLETPSGFVETSSRAPDVYALATAYSAGDARIVAHFVLEKDLAAFERGKQVNFSKFLLVQTPRRAETIQVSQAQFDKLRAGTVALQSQLTSKLEPQLAAEAARVSKAVSTTAGESVKVATGEVVPVSIDRNDARVVSYSVLANASVNGNKGSVTRNMVASTAACLLAGKVIMLNSYRVFQSPRDLQANRELLASWVSSTFSVN
jgi:hypothetical protein